METVGIIGLGNIGSSVAKRLIQLNYEVLVFDIDPRKVINLESIGAKGTDEISHLVSKAKFIITSLPNDTILSDVILGKGGVLEAVISKKILVELSTVLPKTIVNICNLAKEKKLEIIDCPISGGPLEAEKGELSLIVAANEATYRESLPLLQNLSKQIHYVSNKLGSGKAVKLINNIMTMGNVLVAAEAFSFGIRYGLDPENLYNILCKTGGSSHHFVKRFPKIVNNDYSAWFSMDLGKKDLELAEKWCEENNFPSEVTSFVKSFYEKGVASGLASEDIVAIAKLFLKT